MAASKNYYEEIGVSQSATLEEITNAVKQLVKTNHPDNFTDAKDRENAQQRLRMVKRAYETLKDENLRWEYDLSLFGDSENTSNHNATKHPAKSKTSSFKFISGLILGTATVTASGTIYLSGLNCSTQRNVIDATICEKTQPIRSLFGSVEKSPVVEESQTKPEETIAQNSVVEQVKPVDEKLPSAEVAVTPEIEHPKNEPTPALASATVSFDNSTPVKSEPELPTATASFQPVASTPVATTNNANDECYNLWYQRNLIYAQNGYCFTSNLGKEAFKEFKCFTSSQNLPNKDQVRANNLKSREAALNCNVDTNSTTIPTATKNVAPVQNPIATTPNLTPSTLPETSVQSANTNPIQTLVAEGVGITPQDAAQNAAENALKNVVGAFIDSNMNLEKKTLIYDGLKSETKNISKDIKEYSQGSIKSFEIVDVKQEAGLYRLKAKVTVHNERFSAYVNQLAKGEGQISDDIKTKALVDIKQKGNLKEILTQNIIQPILSGTVQDIKVSNLDLLSNAIKQNKLPESRAIPEDIIGSDIFIVFQVDVVLKNNFIKNIEQIFSEIALIQEEMSNESNVRSVPVMPRQKDNFKISYLSSYDEKIKKNIEFDIDKQEVIYSQFSLINKKSLLGLGLKIIFKDNENTSLQIENLNECIQHSYTRNPANCLIANYDDYDSRPWILYRVNESVLLKKNSFFVYVKTTPDIFSKLKKIEVKLN